MENMVILFSADFWNDKKGKLKERFPALTDYDLEYQPGNLGELMNGLEVKLNISGNELREMLKAL